MRGAEVAASTLSAAAASDYRAAAILLKGRGLLDGRTAAAADPSPVNEFLQAVPPGKRRVFELRLRELVLSLREDSEEARDVPAGVRVETPDASRAEARSDG